ncbi:hypothetical protein SRDD_34380 [Serratia sp. DD3]|nr:hypothetical protein SRDD_34380 [Serratia sp. DD3]
MMIRLLFILYIVTFFLCNGKNNSISQPVCWKKKD